MSEKETRWKTAPGDLITVPSLYEKEWRDLPDYEQQNLMPTRSIVVHFYNDDEIREFASLVGQNVTDKTKSIYYEQQSQPKFFSTYRWVRPRKTYPRYPIYIISKGRWETRLTHKELLRLGVPHRVVIEPTEYEQYSAVIDPALLLVLPFHDLGQGSIPARNWVWEHSISEGHAKHWILDDNIGKFFRFHHNAIIPVTDGVCFEVCEDITDRYCNVRMSGLNYMMFVKRKSDASPPFLLNTRVYSCILLDNSTKHRWRGRYNEDTDLSIRILKDGDCTILLNAFVCEKSQTLTMKGGNTDTVYAEDNARYKMAESLKNQHGDVATITRKWGRAQHQVDYSPFRLNRLKPKENDRRVDLANYDLILQRKDDDGVWVPADITEAQ